MLASGLVAGLALFIVSSYLLAWFEERSLAAVMRRFGLRRRPGWLVAPQLSGRFGRFWIQLELVERGGAELTIEGPDLPREIGFAPLPRSMGEPSWLGPISATGHEMTLLVVFDQALRDAANELTSTAAARLEGGRLSFSYRGPLYGLLPFVERTVRFAARLGERPAADLPTLLTRFREEHHPETRLRIYEWLLRLARGDERRALITLGLEDAVPEIRFLAARRVGPRGFATLEALVLTGPRALRGRALRFLSRQFPPPSVEPSALHALRDDDAALRLIAAQVLGRAPSELGFRALLEATRDREPDVAAGAALALTATPADHEGPSAARAALLEPALLALLATPHPAVRRAALLGLTDFGTGLALAALRAIELSEAKQPDGLAPLAERARTAIEHRLVSAPSGALSLVRGGELQLIEDASQLALV